MKKVKPQRASLTFRFRLIVSLAGLAVVILLAQVVRAQDGKDVKPSIHPELKEHSRQFDKKIFKIADNVYSVVGWDLANTIMVEGDNGIIIVDTGTGIDAAREVETELRKISRKPVVAIVYTHFHPDHINGVKAYTTEEDVKSGKVAIYAHETLLKNVQNQGGTIGPILGIRSGYSFGSFLDEDDRKEMNQGLGPTVRRGVATFIAPTKTFNDKLDVTIAGVTNADGLRAERSAGRDRNFPPAKSRLVIRRSHSSASLSKHPHVARDCFS